MRWVGLVLVAVGALVLGVQGFGGDTAQAGGAAEPAPVNVPVLGGIALVTGLLLLAGGRRD